MMLVLIYLLLGVLWLVDKAELYLLDPLIAGKDEVDHLYKMITILGSPPKHWQEGLKSAYKHGIRLPKRDKQDLRYLIQNASKEAIELMESMFTYIPEKRIKAEQILQHTYFGSRRHEPVNRLSRRRRSSNKIKS